MSRIYNRPMTKRAKGMTEGGRTKIAVSFPTALFKRLADQAFKDGIAFQEQVRRFCEAGFKK